MDKFTALEERLTHLDKAYQKLHQQHQSMMTSYQQLIEMLELTAENFDRWNFTNRITIYDGKYYPCFDDKADGIIIRAKRVP